MSASTNLQQSPQHRHPYGRMATEFGARSMTHTYRNVPDYHTPVIDYDSPGYQAAARMATGVPVPAPLSASGGDAGSMSLHDTYMLPRSFVLPSTAVSSFPTSNGGGGDDAWGQHRPANPGLVSREFDGKHQGVGGVQVLPYDGMSRPPPGVVRVQQQEQQVRRPLSAGQGTQAAAHSSPHHLDERRAHSSRPASTAASLPGSLSSSLQAKELHQMADGAGIALPVAKLYSADQFEHPVKMARLPLSQWEKPNAALSVRFLTSVESKHRPQHYRGGGVYRSASVDLGRQPANRTRPSSADDRMAYKRSLQGRNDSFSPVSFDNLRVGHNMRAMARMNGPLAGRHKQDMLDRMLDQQLEFDTREQFRLAARDIINNIVLVDSGKVLTPEQQAQRDLAFRLLDEAFPLAHEQNQGRRSNGTENYGERRGLSRPSSSRSTRSDSVLVRDKARMGASSPMSDSAYPSSRGRQVWSARKDASTLWQQSLSSDDHELLIEALRTELGLLHNGMKHH